MFAFPRHAPFLRHSWRFVNLYHILRPPSAPLSLGISRPRSPARPSPRLSTFYQMDDIYFSTPLVTLILLQPNFPALQILPRSASHLHIAIHRCFSHTQLPFFSRLSTIPSHFNCLFCVLLLYIFFLAFLNCHSWPHLQGCSGSRPLVPPTLFSSPVYLC